MIKDAPDDHVPLYLSAQSDPDPHGQAALLLVESLVYNFLEKKLLSRKEALDLIESASIVKLEMVDAGDERYEAAATSLLLLDRIAKSIEAYHIE